MRKIPPKTVWIIVFILSILGQTMRIANKNPIDGIRTE